jgi:putative glutamine amidotransferase
MNKSPLIIVSSSTQRHGKEMSDFSLSLSNRYTEAVIEAGGLPLVVPCTTSMEAVAGLVERCDGLLLTGGEDVQTNLYAQNIPEELAKTVKENEPERDLLELMLIERALAQTKPLLAICRGHQILNIALGGDLVVDIPSQVRNPLDHRQLGRKFEAVHGVEIAGDSLLGRIHGEKTLGVNSTHHQAVGRIAPVLRATAIASDGVVEAMELKDPSRLPFLLSVQFHPERLTSLHRTFRGIFSAFVRVAAALRG